METIQVVGAALCLGAEEAAVEEVVSEALAPWRRALEAGRRPGARLGLAATALLAALAVGATRRRRSVRGRDMEERRKRQRERLQREHAARAGPHTEGVASRRRSGGLRSRATRQRPRDDSAFHSRPLGAGGKVPASGASQEEPVSKGQEKEQKAEKSSAEETGGTGDSSYRQRTADAIAKLKQREESRKKNLPLGTITSSIVVHVVVRGAAQTEQRLYLPKGTAIHSILSNITAVAGRPLERLRITYRGCLVKDFGRLESSGRLSETVFLLSHGDSIRVTT